jgi:hypothetical protein
MATVMEEHNQSNNYRNMNSSKQQLDDQYVKSTHHAVRTSWVSSPEAHPPLKVAFHSS